MTTARSQLVDINSPGYFHCVSRCVRRASLCGLDQFTGQSFEHRCDCIEERLLELADIFAISLYAYAVMSNHFHVALRVDPFPTHGWSDNEIAARWVRVFHAMDRGSIPTPANARNRRCSAQPCDSGVAPLRSAKNGVRFTYCTGLGSVSRSNPALFGGHP